MDAIFYYMYFNPISTLICQKKAIVFDLFHTLTAPEITAPSGLTTSQILGIEMEIWNRQLTERSIDRLKGVEKDPYLIIEKLARAINPNISNELIVQATEHRLKRFDNALTLIPKETCDVLRALKESGKKLALLSNADVIESKSWNKSPIAHFFDSVIFSCDVGFVKPEREIFEICLHQLCELPQNCAFVGDGGSNELSGAKASGMTSILITGIIEKIWPHKIEKFKPDADFVIRDLAELIQTETNH